MSDLIAIMFDDDRDAVEALRALRRTEAEGKIEFDDTAVIARDPEGKLWVKDELDSGIELGATVGGAVGLLLGPLGLIAGALGGAAWGRTQERGVDQVFVDQVKNALRPDSSALFLMIRAADATALVEALSPFEGRVFRSTLSAESAEVLNAAMRGELDTVVE